MKLVLATWNYAKIEWLTKSFSKLNLPIIPIDKSKIEDVEETGNTCAENALIKIRAVGIQNNSIIIGEDSALSIEALNGFPGAKTARWMAGTDDDRSKKILELMKDISPKRRFAKFLSAVALLFPNGEEQIFLGEIHGKISSKLVGVSGKGYQRIFLLENGNSIAESGNNIIHPNNHRDQAISKAIDEINSWIAKYAE